MPGCPRSPAAIMEHMSKTIYDQLGGSDVVKTAVTVFYNRVLDDESLAKWFEDIDLSRLRAHQRAFLTAALGGPQVFAGRDLSESHAGMAITDEAFESIVNHLLTALADLDVAQPAIDEVGARLDELRDQIVTA